MNLCFLQKPYENIETANGNHWYRLNESIWNEEPAVKALSWRMLHRLKQFDWVNKLLDIAYPYDETLAWAKGAVDGDNNIKHLDCFGAMFSNGDNVLITKTLNVKDANFSAKVGTVVKKYAWWLITRNKLREK